MRNLIHNIKGFFYEIWGMLHKDFWSFIIFLQNYVVNAFGTHDEIEELKNIDSTNDKKLFKLITEVRIVIDPLKLANGIHIHPFRRDFSVKTKLFDFNWSEFIEIFCRR